MLNLNKNITLIVHILFFVGVVACSNNETNKEEHAHDDEIYLTEKQINSTSIQVGSLETLTLGDTLRVQAQVQAPPQSLAQLHLATEAFVKSTSKYAGSPVRKGEVLGTFFHPSLIKMQQDYLAIKANYSVVEQEFERQKNLYSDSASSSKLLQQAKASFETSQAQLFAMESMLKQNRIDPASISSSRLIEEISLKAPFAGVLTQVNSNLGKLLVPEMCVFEILDTSHLHIEIEIFPKDIHKVKKGQILYFFPSGLSDVYQAEIVLVGAEVDPIKRSIHVHAHPKSNSLLQLKLNEYLQGYLITNSNSYQVLSKESVFKDGEKWFAFVNEEKGHFKPVEVKVGKIFKNHVEIVEPIRNDYVISGAYILQSAMSGEGGHTH